MIFRTVWAGLLLAFLSGVTLADECFRYAGEEAPVVSFIGRSGPEIRFIDGQPPSLVVQPHPDIDVGSFKAYLAGKDITSSFLDGELFREVVDFPAIESIADLKVETLFLADKANPRWRGCDSPPLRWRVWTVTPQELEIETRVTVVDGNGEQASDLRFEESGGVKHLSPSGEM